MCMCVCINEKLPSTNCVKHLHMITPVQQTRNSVNLMGFQYTAHNGFYWGLRSALTISAYVPVRVISSQDTYTFNIERTDVGFGAYLAIGYDFGKKINPNSYNAR